MRGALLFLTLFFWATLPFKGKDKGPSRIAQMYVHIHPFSKPQATCTNSLYTPWATDMGWDMYCWSGKQPMLPAYPNGTKKDLRATLPREASRMLYQVS